MTLRWRTNPFVCQILLQNYFSLHSVEKLGIKQYMYSFEISTFAQWT